MHRCTISSITQLPETRLVNSLTMTRIFISVIRYEEEFNDKWKIKRKRLIYFRLKLTLIFRNLKFAVMR